MTAADLTEARRLLKDLRLCETMHDEFGVEMAYRRVTAWLVPRAEQLIDLAEKGLEG